MHGNASLDRTTFNTRCILEAIGKRDIKVYPGASKPIVRKAVHAADIHGNQGRFASRPPIDQRQAHPVWMALLYSRNQLRPPRLGPTT